MEDLNQSEREKLMMELIDGFSSLYEEVQLLNYKNRMLEDKLSTTQQMYQALADKYAPYDDEDTHHKTYEMATDDEENEKSYQFNKPIRWTKVSLRGQDGRKDAQARQMIKTGVTARNKLAVLLGSSHGLSLPLHVPKSQSSRGSGDEGSGPRPSESPPPASLEHDFTTKGREGELQCPFATNGGGKLNHHPSFSRPRPSAVTIPQDMDASPSEPSHGPTDDNTQNRRSSPSAPPSTTNSRATGQCPIRFLNQRSPEEVAEYFENHKHEIPRSHAVCVKRYQSNAESIRKLDAKYGNLVSMIQGLGVKHQSLLPVKDGENPAADSEGAPNDRVEKWAKAVSNSMSKQENDFGGVQEPREGHFDRSMKEVRVGESPGRPWGIPVPAQETPMKLSGNVETEGQGYTSASPARGVSRVKTKSDNDIFVSKTREQTQHAGSQSLVDADQVESIRLEDNAAFIQPQQITSHGQGRSARPEQMVFTGPVFIGYPVEQALSLMRQAGLGTSEQQR